MKNKKISGFTIIELSLSIAFISVLLIAIAVITTNIIATYRRGLILKQVNNYGTELVGDIRKSITNATVNSFESLCKNVYGTKSGACEDDKAGSLINFYDVAEVELNRSDSENPTVPIHGVFCSGTYSYIWNSGYLFNNDIKVNTNPADQKIGLRYKISPSGSGDSTVTIEPDNLRLLKILDPTRSVCETMLSREYIISGNNIRMNDYYTKNDADGKYYIDITQKNAIMEEPIELLPASGGNGNFAIYDFNVQVADQDKLGKNSFYSGFFILGTVEGGINIKAAGDFCAPPGEYGQSSFDYCAINKFNFAMRATGE